MYPAAELSEECLVIRNWLKMTGSVWFQEYLGKLDNFGHNRSFLSDTASISTRYALMEIQTSRMFKSFLNSALPYGQPVFRRDVHAIAFFDSVKIDKCLKLRQRGVDAHVA